MTYKEALDYLYSRLPMYQRIGAAAYKADLTNTLKICQVLRNPEKKLKTIHIGGTNGKGSTSHMLAAALQQEGYRTGLYTSPHLIDFRERIRVNGKMISKRYIVEFIEKYKQPFEKIEPSFFEWTVGLAFQYFIDSKVDIAVVEVGLGGRLDSTNVIDPELSIITNISLDHTNLLGDTKQKIAKEKAGIIKKGKFCIIGQRDEETDMVFIEKAKNENAILLFAEDRYTVKRNASGSMKLLNFQVKKDDKVLFKNISCDLMGQYQKKNLCTFFAALDVLNYCGIKLRKHSVESALRNVRSLTGLRGRWETLSKKPLIIADTGHNEDGIKEVVKCLKGEKFKKLHFVLGMVNDKEIDTILKLLPGKASYYFCKASVPRALNALELMEKGKTYGLKGDYYDQVAKALLAARKNAGKSDLIFIGGSTFVVADALKLNI